MEDNFNAYILNCYDYVTDKDGKIKIKRLDIDFNEKEENKLKLNEMEDGKLIKIC